jgi:hypothetical protein
MKTLVVGGNFGLHPRPSKIIDLLAKAIKADKIYNGGYITEYKNELKEIDLSGYDLIIWAANVANSWRKFYPKKDPGAVLIVTKVLEENRTQADALQRVFAMHGNAVITIDKEEELLFTFKLVDALNNSWGESHNIENLVEYITKFYKWSKGSIRVGTKQYAPKNLSRLIEINKQLADAFEQTPMGRYFGNLSTRCSKMFPSAKHNNGTKIWVSRRNVNKKRLTEEDMILTFKNEKEINYIGTNKPSVDTPIQLDLYELFPNINYMIHGHAFIKNAPVTSHYYPCGDLREVGVAALLINQTGNGIINLKNHGFLIYAKTIENFEKIVNELTFNEELK